jgi:hypothetical protein
MEGLLGNGLADRQARRQGFIVHLYTRRRGARGSLVLGNDPGHRLAVVADERGGDQRLVVQDGAGVVLAGNVRRSQHAHHARHGRRGRRVDREHARMRVRRLHRPQAQQTRRRMLFVGIDRAAADVAFRAFVPAAHARVSGRCSATNFANRFPQRLRR